MLALPRRLPPPFALAAVALVVVHAALMAAGAPGRGWSAAGAIVAVGLAWAHALPPGVSRSATLKLAVSVPLAGIVLSVSLIFLSLLRVPVTAPTVLALVVALVAAGAWASARSPVKAAREPAWTVLALAAVTLAASAIALWVLGDAPVPGNDWAKYLLYADEIARQHRLLIDNPFWMGGVPFREDPGAPSVYAAWMLLSGAPAGQLAWGVWPVWVATALSAWAAAGALWGRRAGPVAAVAIIACPASVNILGWHGLANTWGLAVMPFVLLCAGQIARGRDRRAWWPWLIVSFAALLAAHRLTASITTLALAGAFVVYLAAGLAGARTRRRWRRRLRAFKRAGVPPARQLAAEWAPVAAAAAGLVAVVVDMWLRNRGSGGLQAYTAYTDTRLHWSQVAGDSTWPAVIVLVVCLAAGTLARSLRRDRAWWLAPCVAAALLVYAYGWVFEMPGFYSRAAFYLPVVLALAAGAVASRAPRWWVGGVLATAAVAAAAAMPERVHDLRVFYRLADEPGLRGLGWLEERLQPGETVVTDRCWSFLGTWLLRHPTYAALAPRDIQPAAELAGARKAKDILAGGAGAGALARELGVRYAIVNPWCQHNAKTKAPPGAQVAYLSHRMVVLAVRQADDPHTGTVPAG